MKQNGMPPRPEDPQQIAAHTLAYDEQHARSDRDGTRDHDVSQNIAALLKHITGPPPFDLLDFGCGPGRDLDTVRALGHRAVGLEGAPGMAALARAHSGYEVLEQNFLQLDLPAQRYDGVFANAVLFHLPSPLLPQVLRHLHACLRPAGVLFSSNPRGDGEEGWNGERYGAFHDWPTWRALVTAAGFDELEHYHRPTGLPIAQQPWLASVWRRR
jgi:SAM-dependent methyltransferase